MFIISAWKSALNRSGSRYLETHIGVANHSVAGGLKNSQRIEHIVLFYEMLEWRCIILRAFHVYDRG